MKFVFAVYLFGLVGILIVPVALVSQNRLYGEWHSTIMNKLIHILTRELKPPQKVDRKLCSKMLILLENV